MENKNIPEANLSVFSKFIKSLTQPEIYVSLVKESFRKTVFYVLLMAVIFGGAIGICKAYRYSNRLSSTIKLIKDDSSKLKFANGELSIQGGSPIVFESSRGLFAIDTEGRLDRSYINKFQEVILISKDSLFIQDEPGNIQEISFEVFQGIEFTQEDIISFFNLLRIGSVLLAIAIPILFFISEFISAFVVALFAYIINSISIKLKINFKDMYKLAFYSLTLVILIQTFLSLIKANIPFFSFFYFAISIVYLCLGLNLIKRTQENL